ncbi:MAG: hypothetical protein EA401_12870 [Planctomycetota bacterium]|nr:MAG: hypothetical protein EA401_12870 [Planctomycetota bacterium]
MYSSTMRLCLAIMCSITLALGAQLAAEEGAGARLVSVSAVDNQTLLIHVQEGEVEFADDASGDTAYSGHYHEPHLNWVVNYGALQVANATQASNWSLSSTDDGAYGGGGREPSAVHRKSKMNGMAEYGWSTELNDYEYDYTLEHFLYLRLPEPMQQGASYTLDIPASANINATTSTFTYDIFHSRSEAIKVNLVGYRADGSIKSADVFSWMGDGGHRDYAGHVGNNIYLYDVDNGTQHGPLGTLSLWHAGGGEGDQGHNFARSPVWRADFTGFDTPGTYRLVIEGIGASQDFEIRNDIYFEPFRVSTLGFFYMRIGQDSMDMDPVPRRPLLMPGEDGFKVYETTLHPWHDLWKVPLNPDMSYRYPVDGGSSYDEDRLYADPWDEPEHFALFSTGIEHPNAWGGHSDALDWDRHLAHVSIIYDLLLPYILSDGALHDDDLGIAESGNGIPDVIDEAQYEVDYFLRIRTSDGGYSHGLSDPTGNKTMSYSNGRAYLAAPTAMAAWANAANAAILAEAFRIAGETALMDYYADAAIEAFTHAANMPLEDQMLDHVQGIGEGAMRGRDFKHMAAGFLYNVTGDTAWEDMVEAESVVRTDSSQQLIMPYQNEATARNQLYGTVAYLFTPRTVNYPELQGRMREAVIAQALSEEVYWRDQRPSRRSIDSWSGYFITVQNVHRSIVAHAVSEDPEVRANLMDALVLEADWGLGRNALNMIQMTTATTNLADRRSVIHMYTSGRNDGTEGLHPGHTPYMNMDDWGAPMAMGTPSMYYEMGYPNSDSHGEWKDTWPRGELFYNTRFSWTHSEHTPQQTMRGKQALYGYLYVADRDVVPPERFTLTLVAENGSIQPTPSLATYPTGTEVTLTPQPNNGFIFEEWSGDASGNTSPLIITMTEDQTITAHFVAAPLHTLTVEHGSGGGEYSQGQIITVTANEPPSGYTFAGWSGATEHLANAAASSTTLTMPDQAVSMSATYQAIPAIPDIIIYRAGESRITGAWGDGLSELADGAFEGDEHYRFSYELDNWWAGFGLDITQIDAAEHTALQFAYRGPGAGHTLMVAVRSAAGDHDFFTIPLRDTYGIIDIPLDDLFNGAGDAQITGLQFGVSGAETGNGVVEIDAIVLRGNDIEPPIERIITLHPLPEQRWMMLDPPAGLTEEEDEHTGAQRFLDLDRSASHLFQVEASAPESSF